MRKLPLVASDRRALVAIVAFGVGGAFASLAAVAPQSSVAPPQARPAVVVWDRQNPLPQPQGRGRATQPPPPLVTTGLIVGRVIDAASGKPIAGVTVTLGGGPSRTATPPTPGVPAAAVLPPPPPPRILTDAEGRFAFRSLTRGNYSINADKPGYAGGAYGRARPNGPTRPLQLDDNERMGDVTIRVFKLASITGVMTDEAGEPVVNARVVAYRRALVSGRRVLTPGGQAQTDDRGVYRIFSLQPAEYVVAAPMSSHSAPVTAASTPAASQNFSATSQNLTSGAPTAGSGGRLLSADARFAVQSVALGAAPDAAGRWRGYATHYFPGVPAASAAQPIVLSSGEERSGVDLPMRYVPVSNVSGMVIAPDTPAANYLLRLVPSETGDMSSEPETATAVTDGSGAFTFLAVPAGQYVIQTVRAPREPLQFLDFQPAPGGGIVSASRPTPSTRKPDPLLWAVTAITVGDADIEGVGLTLREGLTVSGRLEFSGSRPRPDGQRLAQIPIVVESAAGRDAITTPGPPSRVQPDGRFVAGPRVPGKYFLRVGGAPPGFIVQSITVNGVDATERPFELTTQSLSNVVVTFTDLIASMSGTVRGTQPGADSVAVVLFPADSTAWKDFGINPARMRLTRTGPSGSFSFGSLLHGDYFVIAIRDEFSSEWQDPAFLDVLSRAAHRLTLGHGEKRTLDLPLSDARPPGIGRTTRHESRADPEHVGRAFRPGDSGGAEAPPYIDQGDAGRAFGSANVGSGPFAHEASSEGQVRDGRALEPAGTGSLSGVVMVDDGSARPARLARVSVRGGGLRGERIALTDDGGRFTIAWLPAGEYVVMVTKPPYSVMYYGARRPESGPGTSVRVEAGQAVTGINVTMPRGAVIAGTVLDPLGQPAPNVRAMLQQYVVRNGERVLGNTRSPGVTTDDRGMYRMYGLLPGTYVLSFTPPNMGSNVELRQLSDSEMRAAIAEAQQVSAPLPSPGTPRAIALAPPGIPPAPNLGGRSVGYSPVYYPGTTRPEEAAEIVVTAGQEFHANMQVQLVPTARLEGRIIAPDGQSLSNMQVMLQRMTPSATTSSSSVRHQEGLFQAVGVAVGRYSLIAFAERPAPRVPPTPGAPPSPPAPSRILWAQQTIDVTGDDQTNLMLTLGPPMSISGRVVFDGATRPDPKTVQVRLESTGSPPPFRMPAPASPDAAGAFTISGVLPGKYRLVATVASGTAAPWSMIASTMDGEDTIVTPMEFSRDRVVTTAIVTLTDQPSEISGTLVDAGGRPVAGMIVVLFSANRATWLMNPTRLNRMSAPSADGTFRFTATLPGEYYLAVVTELDNTLWNDPAFKEQLAAAAITLSVAKGEKKVQNLRVR